jgi:hypothetical protein
MKRRCSNLALLTLALFLANIAHAQDIDRPFAPGDTFSISHTPMNAKLVPLDCDAKKIPIHSYKHAGNEATFLIPEDSPTCTYEVLGTKIKVIRLGKPTAEVKSASVTPPKQTGHSTPK